VARRRYGKSPAISTAGQQERPRDPQTVAEEFPLGSEPSAPTAQPRAEFGKPEPEATPEPAQHFQSSLGEQLRQQQAYQQQQQQQPQPQHDPLLMYLASIPGLGLPKLNFLYQHFAQRPHLLNNDYWQLIKMAHEITTKDRNIPEDSNEYFAHMHALLNQHAASPPPTALPPTPEPRPQPMTHVDVEKVENAEGEPEEAHIRAEHVAAPVSRGDYARSIEPEQSSPSQVRLSAEERDIAARSGISETQYAANKLKMLRMKKSGLVKD
jgi:hypothetical protein